jgi:NADPH2:quinone reductase
MRTILVRAFGGPEVLRLEDAPAPTPGAGDVLVRVRAAGVNPVDTYIRSGAYARKPDLPYTPGTDGAGEVEAIGAGVTGVGVGDRVYIAGDNASATFSPGTYAEQTICRPSQLHPLPAHVTFGQGAAIGVPYGTAYRALFIRAAAKAGETVLVHGATGGVGIAAVEIARAHGLTVIGTGGSDRGLKAVRERGAHLVVSHKDASYLDVVMQSTGGRGVDVVLEMAAHINLDRDLTVLARGGRIVVIGNRGRVEIDPRGAMARDGAILGMTLFNSPAAEIASMHAAIVAGLNNKTLNPIVGREFPLADAGLAHQAVMEPGALGKIVLTT